MNIFILTFAIILPKKQVIKIRKTEAGSDSDGGETHTYFRLQNFNSICLLHANHSQLFIYICIYVFGLYKMKYLCKCNNVLLQNTSLITGGSSTHETSSRVRTGNFRCPDAHRPICPSACQTSHDARPGTIRCPDGHR